MADHDPNQDTGRRITEVPGDTNSGDIVDRTGEQMPRQSHDGVGGDERDRSAHVNDEDQDTRRRDSDPVDPSRRHDNPRTGKISDW